MLDARNHRGQRCSRVHMELARSRLCREHKPTLEDQPLLIQPANLLGANVIPCGRRLT
ncbi:hypothetical protein J6590_047100, partial [Homalodisca vitripennis]